MNNLGTLENHASMYIFSQNIPIYTIHCIFQLKWTVKAVKHQQLLFLFTQIMITGQIIKVLLLCGSLQKTMLWPQNALP